MSKLIDNNGVIYKSIRDFVRKTGCGRRHVMAQIKERGVYTNKTRGLKAWVYDPKDSHSAPTPTSTDRVLKLIAERYSEEELKLLSKGKGLEDRNLSYPTISLKGKHHKIGVISDGHLGSKYSPIEFHLKAFETFKKEGCECIMHCGDLVEGLNPKRADTQIYELSHIGYKEQKNLAVEVFSENKLPVYAISGNHDAWYSSMGANIVEDICSEVPNMHYLGFNQADINIDGAVLRLFHGGDGNCFTEGTEILTKDNGWVDFKDLTMGMEVATMTKDGHVFEWQKPIEITKQAYEGDVYTFKSRRFDFSVTPNHRLWVKYNQSINKPHRADKYPQKAHYKYDDKWHDYAAEDIARGWRKQKWQIPTCAEGYKQSDFTQYVDVPMLIPKNKGMESKMHHIGRLDILTLAELVAWYVTEGYACDKHVTISQYNSVNPDNHAQIVRLGALIGVTPYITDKSVTFYSKELADYLMSICGSGSRNKSIPSFLKNNSKEVLRVIFDTMIKGDGWVANAKNEQYGYRSISKQLLSDMGEIAIKLGYSVTFNKDSVSICSIQKYPSMVKRPEQEYYNGMIYCCSVPNELIYVRRNGKCFFSHNSYALSYRLQKLAESFTGGKKPNILLSGHVHKMCYVFDRMIHCVSVPSLQMQTAWMASKKLAAHTGFLIIEFDSNANGVCNFQFRYYPFYA